MKKNPFKLPQKVVRLVSAPPLHSDEPITSPEAAIRAMAKELKGYDREVICIVNLQSDYRPINFSIVSMGALSEAVAHPRELLKNVFLSNAAGIIMLHNHPSGRIDPSQLDVEITDRMNQICQLVGINLLDHVIVSGRDESKYFSMYENRYMGTRELRFVTAAGEIEWGNKFEKLAEKNMEMN